MQIVSCWLGTMGSDCRPIVPWRLMGLAQTGLAQTGSAQTGSAQTLFGPDGFGPDGFGPDGFGPDGFGQDGFGRSRRYCLPILWDNQLFMLGLRLAGSTAALLFRADRCSC